jgi:hypothetical protein
MRALLQIKNRKEDLQHQQVIAITVYQKIREWYLQHHDPVKVLQSQDAHCLLRCAELKKPPKTKKIETDKLSTKVSEAGHLNPKP